MMILDLPCPIKHLTGISCPGCGMTRAVLSALRLEISAAFEFHPLWILILPIVILLVFFNKKKTRLAFSVTLWSSALLFAGMWIYRLLSNDSVVTFNIEGGMIYMLIQKITELFK